MFRESESRLQGWHASPAPKRGVEWWVLAVLTLLLVAGGLFYWLTDDVPRATYCLLGQWFLWTVARAR